jgi:hypothetical protein
MAVEAAGTRQCLVQHLHTSAYVSIRQHTSAYVSSVDAAGTRQCLVQHLHTSAYVSIRQHTSAYVSISQLSRSGREVSSVPCPAPVCRQHTSAYVSIRQHTSAYVSIQAYVSIRQHTYLREVGCSDDDQPLRGAEACQKIS